MSQFTNAWKSLNKNTKPVEQKVNLFHVQKSNSLTREDKAIIKKEIIKSVMAGNITKDEGDAFAICTASVGRENKEKYESCVLQVKQDLGLIKEITPEEEEQIATASEEATGEAEKANHKWDSAYEEEVIDEENNVDRPEQDNKEKDMGIENAGEVPNSLLAAQDLEGETHSTTKPGGDLDSGTEEKDASGPMPERINY